MWLQCVRQTISRGKKNIKRKTFFAAPTTNSTLGQQSENIVLFHFSEYQLMLTASWTAVFTPQKYTITHHPQSSHLVWAPVSWILPHLICSLRVQTRSRGKEKLLRRQLSLLMCVCRWLRVNMNHLSQCCWTDTKDPVLQQLSTECLVYSINFPSGFWIQSVFQSQY